MTDVVGVPHTISGFWRRLGAFAIDVVSIGIVGLVIGYSIGDQLVALGTWGRLVGFAVALAYFGILNSRLSGGQTIGKRLLKIKVVDGRGSLLSLPRSLLRFVPFGVPWFLNNAPFPESVLFSPWVYVLSILVFGMGLSIIYLSIFNRRTRQSLHDLLVDSYVVKAEPSVAPAVVAPWPVHLGICALLIVAAGVAPYFTLRLAEREPFASLMRIHQVVNAEAWVVHAKVTKGSSWTASSRSGQSAVRYLRVVAHSRDPNVMDADRARQLAERCISADPSIRSLDVIQVTLVYGFDIGIASSWRSQNYGYPPAELAGESI